MLINFVNIDINIYFNICIIRLRYCFIDGNVYYLLKCVIMVNN